MNPGGGAVSRAAVGEKGRGAGEAFEAGMGDSDAVAACSEASGCGGKVWGGRSGESWEGGTEREPRGAMTIATVAGESGARNSADCRPELRPATWRMGRRGLPAALSNESSVDGLDWSRGLKRSWL